MGRIGWGRGKGMYVLSLKFAFYLYNCVSVYWMYLVSLVTCLFLLNKLFGRYRSVFTLLIPMGASYLAWAALI
jgi:hypothetical protein